MTEFALDRRQYLEFEKIGLGAFMPLTGFMDEDEFRGVCETMRLPGGQLFPLPVVLDMDRDAAERLRGRPKVALTYQGEEVGEFSPQSFYGGDREKAAGQVFATTDPAHPGVSDFLAMAEVFVGGPVVLKKRAAFEFSSYEVTPAEAKQTFAERGWTTIAGFQTRNVPHRAHEHLHRVAMEAVDGLFIQPLVGRRKVGDFLPQAILAGYQCLIEGFYPREKVLLGVLSTFMRYAGPREAVFHAIIRRNYGCTHFIVGRDHAGVGDYYGHNEAHELTRRFQDELGISIMRVHGPYHCAKCGGPVTERTCPHRATAPEYITEISGTAVRALLLDGTQPDPRLMRPEVVSSLRGMPLFVEEDRT